MSTANALIFNFIWDNKPDKIKRQVLYQDFHHGGLRAPNISVLCKALRLAWIRRPLFSEGKNGIETWKRVLIFSLKNIEAFISSYAATMIINCGRIRKFLYIMKRS